MSEGRRKGQAVGCLVSLTVHLSVAALVFWSGQVPPVSHANGDLIANASNPDSRDPDRGAIAVNPRTQSPTPARPGLDDIDSARGVVMPHPRGDPGDSWMTALPRRIETLANTGASRAGGWLDHLWESTVFAAVAGLLTLVFRRNRADVRYWIWFGASIKFFIPFTLLTLLGGYLPLAPAMRNVAEQTLAVATSEPFPHSLPAGLWSAGTMDTSNGSWLGLAILGVWACGFGAIASTRFRMWRRIRAVVRASTPLDLAGVAVPARVQVRSAPGLLEPGVVGWRRPILLMPTGIEHHLTRPQLGAIVAHELCHVRRHDNLTAAIHMVAEAIFWFHPVVWWIGARLIDERERACDEDVLCSVGEPRLYAEAILNVCKRYVESPLVCVSGVSGSSIGRRIDAVMRNEVGDPINQWKKIVLGTATIAVVVVPVGVGALNAPRIRTESQQLPIYALVVARSDGRLGPNLIASNVTDCGPVLPVVRERDRATPPPRNVSPLCGVRVSPGAILGDGLRLSDVADLLSSEVKRTVQDRTGLTGRFNIDLTWTPDQSSDPSLFAALQEQLGLKLEPTTGPVEVLVIDSIERRPSR